MKGWWAVAPVTHRRYVRSSNSKLFPTHKFTFSLNTQYYAFTYSCIANFSVLTDKKHTLELTEFPWYITIKQVSYHSYSFTCSVRSIDPMQIHLMLTRCGEGQFPCHDGECVRLSQRCDHQADCSDSSDEVNCTIISFPQDYFHRIPPPPTSADHLTLYLSIKIISINTFDLIGFRIGIDIILHVEWRDKRLEFLNLRDDVYSNSVKVRRKYSKASLWQSAQ